MWKKIITKQPKTFVIALKDNPISLSQLNDCLLSAKTHNWEVETFWAINGKTLSLESWNSIGVKPLLHKGSMNKLGTWGCFFSHWNLWNKCVELNEPIIILEHDAIIETSWKNINASDALLKLHENYFYPDPNNWYDPNSGTGSSSTHAYYLTPDNAKRLIHFSKTIGGFATDRMIGNKVVNLQHSNTTLVSRQNSYSTTENL